MVENFEKRAEELKKEGIISEYIIANTDNDVTEQMNQLNSMINRGVDALIIDPVSPTSLTSVVARALQQDILVVISNDPAAYEGTWAVVGNNYSWFEIQTKWLAQKLNGKGNIVRIDGVSGNAADTLRLQAAADVLEDYPEINILASAPGGWSQSEAQSIMSTFLSSYDNIDGILMQDVMAEGVLRAYENAGKEPPIMTGDYTFSFLRKWADSDIDTIGVPYAPGISVDGLNVTIGLLQGKKIKEEYLQGNPMDETLKNTIMIDPPYVVTNEGDQNASWMEGYDFTKAITVEEAVNLGEGLPGTAALDASLSQSQINEFFE
jgi:ribose transport system substrate-binding protein